MAAVLPTFHFVGGKGGVGKTTCAAALALAAAETGARVLVASTDPAPSLGDAFEVRLSSRPRRIPGRPQLFAAEIDAAASLRRWLDRRRTLLHSIAVRGTWLDDDDVDRLLRLTLPGIDELSAMFEIAQLAASSRFEHVVVDTAPTGHTLRMLALPATLADVAAVFDAMRDKSRMVESALRGSWVEGPDDRLIADLAGTARNLHALLRDPDRTTVSWVTLPEPVAIAEANAAVAALDAMGIGVGSWIVNRQTPAPPTACAHCRARRAFERRATAALHGSRPLTRVMARDTEPRGIRQLSAIAADFTSPAARERRPPPAPSWRATIGGRPAAAAGIVGDETRLVLIGGKGGVGKSTSAAAIALAAAARWPDRQVLLISTDPAHSLGDVFSTPIADVGVTPRDAPRNLTVRQLDALRALDTVRASYAKAISGMFDRMSGGSGLAASYDRLTLERLLDLAPPGLDELVAVLDVSEAAASARSGWSLVVMDTAPTGHALRLLEMPALLHEWVRTLMSILLKYQDVTGLGTTGTLLLDLSKRIGRLRELLVDPRRTQFVVVTRAAALPRLESVRLLARLRRLRVAAPCVLVNALGRGTCARCRRAAGREARELTAIRSELAGPRPKPTLLLAPAQVPAPIGAKPLARWARTWTAAGPGPGTLRYHRTP